VQAASSVSNLLFCQPFGCIKPYLLWLPYDVLSRKINWLIDWLILVASCMQAFHFHPPSDYCIYMSVQREHDFWVKMSTLWSLESAKVESLFVRFLINTSSVERSLTTRRYDSAGTSYGPMSVSVSVTSQCSIEMNWAGFWHGGFHSSVLHCVKRKFTCLQK